MDPGHPATDGPLRPGILDRYAPHWEPSTLESNAYLVRKYILPRI